MKTIKNLNKYEILMLSGFILWILESWAFGWNDEACCFMEKILDVISWYMIIYGGVSGFALTVAMETAKKMQVVAEIKPADDFWKDLLNNLK